MSDTDSLANCEVSGCTNQMSDYTSCCNVPLCELHYAVYPVCSRRSCASNDEYMCVLCLDRNVYYCQRCMYTLCDDCNTAKNIKAHRCK